MKSFSFYLFSLLLLLISVPAFAQIGIGTTSPAASAALEVSSTSNNKGILIPRLSASQKDAIASPVEGLMVYQTTAPVGFYYYTGTVWKLMVTQTDLDTKVNKVTGKELSTNDYTSAEQTKLAAITGTNTGDQTTISGNAGSATKLATARNINGVAFDGSGNITVTADAGSLSGTTLKSTVTGSSLTSVGTLANLAVTNPIVGSITGNAATATTASTVTTNANLTGDVTSIGNASIIADGAITNSKVTDVSATKITGTLAVANGGTGAATAAAARSNLELENVDNTTDLLKPISTETQTALDLKANTDTANFTKDITVNGIDIGRGKGGNRSSTRIGNQALTNNTTGDSNVAIGDQALSKNTTGLRNNAIGVRSLFKNTTGGENTAIGNMALENNTSGNRNLAIGQQTLSTNTEGIKNVALGYTPLYNNTIGSNNNAIGDEALFYNTTGNNNTGIGSRAGTIISTGSQNTMIGASADVTIGTLSNATALGYQARVATSNTIQLGNTAITAVNTSGTITATGFSGLATNLTGLPLTTGVTGTLAVANGGTGAATLTGLVKGNGTGAMTAAVSGTDYLQAVAPGTSGNVLTSNGSTWVSDKSGSNSIICKIADAPNTILSIGGFEFRYNSATDGGYIEVRSVSSNDNMMVFCQKNTGSWFLGGTSTTQNYRYNTSVYSSWSPVISLATGQTWDNRVTLSGFESFEATMFSMGNGSTIPNPLKSYKIFAAIDGYSQVFLKAEYTIK